MLQRKRVYESPAEDDGVRILVDRLWPRGISKNAARIDHWFKEIAPSTELRQWYRHDPARWPEFQRRYTRELDRKPELVERLIGAIGAGSATLLFSSKESELNNAAVLAQYLSKRRS